MKDQQEQKRMREIQREALGMARELRALAKRCKALGRECDRMPAALAAKVAWDLPFDPERPRRHTIADAAALGFAEIVADENLKPAIEELELVARLDAAAMREDDIHVHALDLAHLARSTPQGAKLSDEQRMTAARRKAAKLVDRVRA